MKPVDLFHLGPPKTATTWFYRCLQEHPQIATSKSDYVCYFDLHYNKGRDWYAAQFDVNSDDQKIYDGTQSYMVSPRAPKRIHKENPHARLFFTLRHPIERAFSHYWHEKKRGVISYDFKQAIEIYDLFENWLGMGLLADHLEHWLSLFPREQLHYIRYEEIKDDPLGAFKTIAGHFEIDDSFVPEFLNKKINVAGPRMNIPQRAVSKIGRMLHLEDNTLINHLSGKSEYMRGVPADLYNKMLEYCIDDIERMEKILGTDLSDWKKEKNPA